MTSRQSRYAAGLALVVVQIVGCGGGNGGAGAPDGGDGRDGAGTADVAVVADVAVEAGRDAGQDIANCPTFAQVTIWSMCTTCHSSTRTDADRKLAPAGVDFDVYERAAAYAEAALSYVFADFMPPAGEPQPTPAQEASLSDWIICGKPR